VLFLIGKLFESLRTSAQRAAETTRAAGAGQLTSEVSLFELLRQDFEKSIHALERRGRTLERAEWVKQRDSLRDDHERVGKYVQSGTLSELEADILFAAPRNIQIELELLEPPSPPPPSAPVQPAAVAKP